MILDNQSHNQKEASLYQINDRYRIKKRLSHSTWLADDLFECQQCLIKDEAGFADLQVIDFLEKIRHPSIPRIIMRQKLSETSLEKTRFQMEREFSGAFVLCEFIEGVSLREWLISHHTDKKSKSVDLLQVLSIMKQCAQVLSFLHEQNDQVLLHLDIKPDNIILTDNNQIFLIDFDAARIFQEDFSLETDPGLKITPEYSAPELIKGKPCPKSDLFALSLTMIQLISGASISSCRNQPLELLVAQIDERYKMAEEKISSLFQDCLSEDTTKRPCSASKLVLRIDEIIDEVRQYHNLQISDNSGSTRLSDKIKKKKSALLYLTKNLSARIDKNVKRYCSLEKQRTQKSVPDKAVTAIWGNAEFGCELASILCNQSSVLVMEADWFNPQADDLLGLAEKKEWLSLKKEHKSMDQALSDQRQGRLTQDRLKSLCLPGRTSNIKYLVPKRDLHHYEHYRPEDFCAVIELASQIFDHVIVLANTFIYDTFTCLSLMIADYILIPLTGNFNDFSTYERSISFLSDKKILTKNNLFYVACSYSSQLDLSWSSMQAITSGKMAGYISDNKNRRLRRSSHKPCTFSLSESNRKEFRALIHSVYLSDQPVKIRLTD